MRDSAWPLLSLLIAALRSYFEPAIELINEGIASQQWEATTAVVSESADPRLPPPPAATGGVDTRPESMTTEQQRALLEAAQKGGGLPNERSYPFEYAFRDENGVTHTGARYALRYDERGVDVRRLVLENAVPVRQADGSQQLTLTAYYDPANPTRSVIERGFPRDVWFPLSLGAVFASGGFRFIHYALRSVK